MLGKIAYWVVLTYLVTNRWRVLAGWNNLFMLFLESNQVVESDQLLVVCHIPYYVR